MRRLRSKCEIRRTDAQRRQPSAGLSLLLVLRRALHMSSGYWAGPIPDARARSHRSGLERARAGSRVLALLGKAVPVGARTGLDATSGRTPRVSQREVVAVVVGSVSSPAATGARSRATAPSPPSMRERCASCAGHRPSRRSSAGRLQTSCSGGSATRSLQLLCVPFPGPSGRALTGAGECQATGMPPSAPKSARYSVRRLTLLYDELAALAPRRQAAREQRS